jgi:hypothetical protein
MPQGNAAVVCMDGFDLLTRQSRLTPFREGKAPDLKAFVDKAEAIGLPLNVGKEVVHCYNSMPLGSELDGEAGVLRHVRTKSHALSVKTLALLSMARTTQAPLQHWAGVYCFAAGFRRCLFSVLQDNFHEITAFTLPNSEQRIMTLDVQEEILVGALLLPLARTNIRA